MAGICDDEQTSASASRSGTASTRSSRSGCSGSPGREGNHGEDVKEYWWYLDSTPTHSWMRWRYHYPQRPFPYERAGRRERRARPGRARVRAGRHRRLRRRPLLGRHRRLRQGRPARPADAVTVENRGPDDGDAARAAHAVVPQHVGLGRPGRTPCRCLAMAGCTGGRRARRRAPRRHRSCWPRTARPRPLFCDNETNTRAAVRSAAAARRTRRTASTTTSCTARRPSTRRGAAPRRRCTTCSTCRRAARGDPAAADRGRDAPGRRPTRRRLRRGLAARQAEADAFYAALTPPATGRRRGAVAAAGVRRAAVGQAVLPLRRRRAGSTATRPGRAAARARRSGRNSAWRHLDNRDVISMPDPWEYPWYAAWDLAFHCVALAHVDPGFAKEQLLLLLREWYMHPNGQLPAYEWAFGDVNPPVHAWAALRVFEIDGGARLRLPGAGAPQAAAELHLVGEPQGRRRATTCSRAASSGWTTSGRSTAPRRCRWPATSSRPTAPRGWRCTASTCSRSRCGWPSTTGLRGHRDQVLRALRLHRRTAHARPRACGTRTTASTTTCSRFPTAARVPLRVRSMVGLLPLCGRDDARRGDPRPLPEFAARLALVPREQAAVPHGHRATRTTAPARPAGCCRSSAATGWMRVLGRCSTRTEFLSPHGMRSLSRHHASTRSSLELGGAVGHRRLRAGRVDARPCSAATPTGAGRSGSPSTTW